MNKVLKYLVLSGFLCVWNISHIDTLQKNKISKLSETGIKTTLSKPYQNLNSFFSPLDNAHRNALSVRFIDLKDLEENEERVSNKDKVRNFSDHLLAVFYIHISNKTSQKKYVNSFAHYSYTRQKPFRLHAKYQVFII
jgi:hypothetical protein